MKPSASFPNILIRKFTSQLLDFLTQFDYFTASKKSGFDQIDLSFLREKQNIVIFVHYFYSHADSIYDKSVVEFLRENDFEVLSVATDSRNPSIESNIHGGENLGRDLGSYRDISKRLLAGGFLGKAIFLNNSVYWRKDVTLIKSLNSLLDNAHEKTISAFTESFQPVCHLQSFGIGVDFRSDFPSIVFSGIRNVRWKKSLVRRGEFSILKSVIEGGGECKFLFPYKMISTAFGDSSVFDSDRDDILRLLKRGVPLNPTQHFWRECLAVGFPGLKKDLVKRNPVRLATLPPVNDSIELDSYFETLEVL